MKKMYQGNWRKKSEGSKCILLGTTVRSVKMKELGAHY